MLIYDIFKMWINAVIKRAFVCASIVVIVSLILYWTVKLNLDALRLFCCYGF